MSCAFHEHFGLLCHLQGKLARGHKDHGLGACVGWPQGRDQRQEVAAGLAGACARLDHDVAPVHEVGQGKGLHWHEPVPAGPCAGCLHARGKLFQDHWSQGIVRMGNFKTVCVGSWYAFLGGDVLGICLLIQ